MYFAPYIDATGVHLPTYEDRLSALVSSFQSIFGLDANLEISAPDYQLLSVFARSLDDLSQLLAYDFVSRNPQYATGAALDLLLPLYGLTRSGATHSRVALTLIGTPSAVLLSAPQALDDAGNLWYCQTAGIRLNSTGEVTVEAICSTAGAIAAPIGTIHRLVSPVAGLSSVVNRAAAVVGNDAETDASCRRRLRLAASAPAVGTIDAIYAAVRSVSGVQSCAVYENDSDAVDDRGIPAHCICVVTQGGLTDPVAQAIFDKKAPGVGTWGSIHTTVVDSYNVSHMIHFQRATMTPVALSIELTPLTGFDASVTDRIKAAIVEYGGNLEIGQDVVVPTLYGLCYGADSSAAPTFSISLLSATASGTSTSGVLSAAWNQRFLIPENMIQILVAE